MARIRRHLRGFSLHTALVLGALLFSFPFAWMVLTSFKMDKEIFREGVSFLTRMMPRIPDPRLRSPYVDPATYAALARPSDEEFASDRWTRELQRQIAGRIAAGIAAVPSPIPASVAYAEFEPEAVQGVWRVLTQRIPPEIWRLPTDNLLDEIGGRVTPDIVRTVADESCRRFAIGDVRIKTDDFREVNLAGGQDPARLWTAAPAGAATFRTDLEGIEPHWIEYDLEASPKIVLEAAFDAGLPVERVRKFRVAFRADETWHTLRFQIEKDGVLYENVQPHFLGGDRWAEVTLQEPSAEDRSLRIKSWTVIREAGRDPRFDLGPNSFRVRLIVERQGAAGAALAKAAFNYRQALRYVPFWRYAATSVALVILNVVLTTLSCSLVAYSFARLRWPGRELCFVLLLATLMIPPQVTQIPGFVIIRTLGWYNTLTPLWIGACFGNAFFIFLMRQFLKGIPKDLEDAARIDGCGYFRVYWNIMLPLVKPTLAAIAIFTFMAVWNDFMGPLIYVNDQRLYPLALGLFAFQLVAGSNYGMLMAGALIMTVPVIAIFFFAQKYFIQGVTLTGMKG